MLIKIVAMFRDLFISSFDASIQFKRALHPAQASRGFVSLVFLVVINNNNNNDNDNKDNNNNDNKDNI